MTPLWIVTIFSLLATIINIYKNPFCFLIWAFTNTIWFMVDLKKKIYPQAVLQFIYILLAIWGLWSWK